MNSNAATNCGDIAKQNNFITEQKLEYINHK